MLLWFPPLLSVSNLSFLTSSLLPPHTDVFTPPHLNLLALPDDPTNPSVFNIWCSGEGSRWWSCSFCHPGRQVEGQLGLQQEVGFPGLEPEGVHSKSPRTQGRTALPGTSPSGSSGSWGPLQLLSKQ